MAKAGVPVVPGYLGEDSHAATVARSRNALGFPVLIKAVAGGGGKGMRRVDAPADFAGALEGAKREARSPRFGDDRVLIEKYVTRPRHIEVQVFADTSRQCRASVRARLLAAAPPPEGDRGSAGAGHEPTMMRAAMGDAAVAAAKAVDYVGAGTVEFIADASEGLRADRFWFMEMNTRLQVEHPVTEMITGLDLVEWQLRVAAGETLPWKQDELRCARPRHRGAALCRRSAAAAFCRPSAQLERLRLPQAGDGVRVDTGVREGDVRDHVLRSDDRQGDRVGRRLAKPPLQNSPRRSRKRRSPACARMRGSSSARCAIRTSSPANRYRLHRPPSGRLAAQTSGRAVICASRGAGRR